MTVPGRRSKRRFAAFRPLTVAVGALIVRSFAKKPWVSARVSGSESGAVSDTASETVSGAVSVFGVRRGVQCSEPRFDETLGSL